MRQDHIANFNQIIGVSAKAAREVIEENARQNRTLTAALPLLDSLSALMTGDVSDEDRESIVKMAAKLAPSGVANTTEQPEKPKVAAIGERQRA